ncbi:MAG TPA: trypsin-like peptidase domain-containing protein [Acidimicrobiales bacterium]|nr:trypsin-like peptidase domain-containing protein [Acidimicrobiales bacterium]
MLVAAALLPAACGDDTDDDDGAGGTGEADGGTEPAAGSAQGDDATGESDDDTGVADTAAVATFDRIPDIVDAVAPSVVAIATDQGEGSGVIVGSDGVVVTNAHVVGDADEVRLTFADATTATAEVVAADPASDLAVLRPDRDGLPALELAEGLPDAGQLAIAIGNPLGFENSVTAGVISGVQRALPGAAGEAPGLVDLIQTDAPISPGSSGGALVNADGRLVGVNVAYIPPAGGAVSIGFAIPAPTVESVVADLLDDGEAEHPFLGVQPATVTPELAERYGLGSEDGALLIDVTPEGPADEAGVRPGDIVVAAGENDVRSVEELVTAVRRAAPGDDLPLTVVRDGEEREVTVTLTNRPEG